jgi:hypothetical protein
VPICPRKVLGDDDVGGLLRPEARELDVALLEHELAAFVAMTAERSSQSISSNGIHAVFREIPFEFETDDVGRWSKNPPRRLLTADSTC